VTATTASNPTNRPARTATAARLAELVLGDLQVVAADRLDGAVAPGHVDQLHPDRLAPPGELAKNRLVRRGDSGRRPSCDRERLHRLSGQVVALLHS
jgi:hypothetical protein